MSALPSPRLALLALSLAGLLLACAAPGAGGRPLLRGLVVRPPDTGVLSMDLQGEVLPVRARDRVRMQLDRLPGAYLELRGRRTREAVLVRDFEILDAGDGLVPLVGRLVVDQDGVTVEDEVTGTHIAVQGRRVGDMRRHHGGRVWVSGTIVGPRRLLVANWGLLLTAHENEGP